MINSNLIFSKMDTPRTQNIYETAPKSLVLSGKCSKNEDSLEFTEGETVLFYDDDEFKNRMNIDLQNFKSDYNSAIEGLSKDLDDTSAIKESRKVLIDGVEILTTLITKLLEDLKKIVVQQSNEENASSIDALRTRVLILAKVAKKEISTYVEGGQSGDNNFEAMKIAVDTKKLLEKIFSEINSYISKLSVKEYNRAIVEALTRTATVLVAFEEKRESLGETRTKKSAADKS